MKFWSLAPDQLLTWKFGREEIEFNVSHKSSVAQRTGFTEMIAEYSLEKKGD